MPNVFWKTLTEEPSKATGFLLFILSAALMIIWLCLKFIFAGHPSDLVSIREIIAVILVSVLLMVIGAYLSTYRARYELEIVRTTSEAVADLLAKAYGTAKSAQEIRDEIATICETLVQVETNQQSASYLIDVWERLARTLLESKAQTIEMRSDQAHSERQSRSTIDQPVQK